MGIWRAISRYCFALCLLCIVASAALAVLGIWEVVTDQEILTKSLGTLAVLFFASLATLIVKKAATYTKPDGEARR